MTEQDRVEYFISELAKVERRLALHTLSLVPHAPDAEDILQQAKLVMWRAFGQFEPGTNFGAWARKIILNQVLSFRKRRQREPLWFDDDVLLLVAEEVERADETLERQQAALKGCVNRLPDEHRAILRERYFGRRSVEDIAEAFQRSEGAVYRLLSRIRKNLHDCITMSTRAEEVELG